MTQQEYEQKKANLISEIERAFDGVERGDGVTFHEAHVIDDYGNEVQRAQARLQDTEKRWQDVPDELLLNGDQTISFLDGRGFHYYLPAYLVWHLRFIDNDDEEFSSNTFESVDFALMAFDGEWMEVERFEMLKTIHLEQFKTLDFEQSKSVAHFLDFQCERVKFLNEQEREEGEFLGWSSDDYQRALDVYWGQFL